MTSPALYLRAERQAELPADWAWLGQAGIAASGTSQAKISPLDLAALAAARLRQLGLPQPKDEAFSALRVSEFLPRLAMPPQADRVISSLAQEAGLAALDPSACAWIKPYLTGPLHPEHEDAAACIALAASPLFAYRAEAESKPLRSTTLSPEPVLWTLEQRSVGEDKGLRHHVAAAALEIAASRHLRMGLRLSASGSSEGLLANTAIFVHIEAGARLDLWLTDPSGPDLQSLTRLVIRQEADSQLHLHLGTTGNALARTSVQVDLAGQRAHAEILGSAALSGGRQAHRHLVIRHLTPEATSRQLFKTVAAEKSRSSVDGTIEVAGGAKGTVAAQTLRSLLIGEDARSDAKPRLLIRNDDVKCNHGATTGHLDEAQRFYLRSRGLTDAQAIALLTRAFLQETLSAVPNGPARQDMDEVLASLLTPPQARAASQGTSP